MSNQKKNEWRNMKFKVAYDPGPIQFIHEKQKAHFYYAITRSPSCPCNQICIIKTLCSKSIYKGTACDSLIEFIDKKEKEVEEYGMWTYE